MADPNPSSPQTPPLDPAGERRLRKRRLARIRRAVRRGEYENALKVSVAADRVFEQIAEPRRRPSP